jgi:GTP-binding protein
LRHIERNSLLLFMVPGDAEDIRKEYDILLNELATFNPDMLSKQRVLAITKCDLLDDELIEMLEETLPEGIPHVFISSVTGLGVSVLKDILWNELNKENFETELSKENLVHRAKDMAKLQDELRAMGQDDDITIEYEDIDEMEDFEYEFDDDFELDDEDEA